MPQLHSALIHLLPNGKVRNSQFYVGNIKGDYGESLKVELEGQKAGLWQDFATGEGGDIFDLWGKVRGLDVKREFPALIEEIEVWLGVSGIKFITIKLLQIILINGTILIKMETL